eukprot:s133_g22.t2
MDDVDVEVKMLQDMLADQCQLQAKQLKSLEDEVALLKTRAQAFAERRARRLATDPLSGIDTAFVRRVEWKLQKCSETIRKMSNNQCIWSSSFSAMGVPDMQLEFFPQGRETSQKGFCALFLWCPGHLKLKYRLEVGSHASIDEDVFTSRIGHGHSNFCFLEALVTFDRLCSSVLFVRGVFASDCDCWHGDGQIRLVLRVAFLLLFPVEGCLECGGGGHRPFLVALLAAVLVALAPGARPLAFLSPAAPGQGTKPRLSRATSGSDTATVPPLMHGATGPVFTAIGAQKGHTAALAVAVAGCLALGRQLSRGVRVLRRAEEAEPHLEPSEKSIETMMKFSNQYAKVTGTKYCEDKSVPAVETLGAPLCPCRHYEDKEKEVKDGYWNCPCVPMRERHECHCMLFLKDDNPFASECSNIDLEEIMKLKDGEI